MQTAVVAATVLVPQAEEGRDGLEGHIAFAVGVDVDPQADDLVWMEC